MSSRTLDALQLTSTGPGHTHALGLALGRVLQPGDVVGLCGELGAGKTALCAGVAEGMDVPDEIYVSSPTFTLINEYPGRFQLVHVDLYRLADPDELWEIGVDDYYRGAVACLVEWFDRFPEHRPPGYLQVRMEVTGDWERTLWLEPLGPQHDALARRWLDQCGR